VVTVEPVVLSVDEENDETLLAVILVRVSPLVIFEPVAAADLQRRMFRPAISRPLQSSMARSTESEDAKLTNA
jgi:hypothetical protein